MTDPFDPPDLPDPTEPTDQLDLPELPGAVEKVVAALRERSARGQVVRLSVDVPTAATAAAEVGCEVGAIANSLVFDADGEPLLIMTSGAHRVDTKHVARALGVRKLRRATPEFVLEHTGQRVGGVAPVGHPAPLRTIVDPWLDRYDRVWAAGGEAAWVFPTAYEELLRITGGDPHDVEPARDPSGPTT